MRGYFDSTSPGLDIKLSGLEIHRGLLINVIYLATFLEWAGQKLVPFKGRTA